MWQYCSLHKMAVLVCEHWPGSCVSVQSYFSEHVKGFPLLILSLFEYLELVIFQTRMAFGQFSLLSVCFIITVLFCLSLQTPKMDLPGLITQSLFFGWCINLQFSTALSINLYFYLFSEFFSAQATRHGFLFLYNWHRTSLFLIKQSLKDCYKRH